MGRALPCKVTSSPCLPGSSLPCGPWSPVTSGCQLIWLLFPPCAGRLGTVPTAPPQNVHAEAVNSTTIRFLWNPPPQQFINGINQGYKVGVGAPRSVGSPGAAPLRRSQGLIFTVGGFHLCPGSGPKAGSSGRGTLPARQWACSTSGA